MKTRYELNVDVLGPGIDQEKRYGSDQRHAERTISELDLDKCKVVPTLCVQESVTTI